MNTGFCCEASCLSPGYVPGHLLVHSVKITRRPSRKYQCGSSRNWNVLGCIRGTSFISYLCQTWSTRVVRPSVGHVPTPAWGTCPLSLLPPTADARNRLHSCLLQPVLPVINDYRMLTKDPQLSFKRHRGKKTPYKQWNSARLCLLLTPSTILLLAEIFARGFNYCPWFLDCSLWVFSMAGERGEGRWKASHVLLCCGHLSKHGSLSTALIPVLSRDTCIHPHLLHLLVPSPLGLGQGPAAQGWAEGQDRGQGFLTLAPEPAAVQHQSALA